jgi:hypothetical protein
MSMPRNQRRNLCPVLLLSLLEDKNTLDAYVDDQSKRNT